jgi:hypothetical protein
MDKSLKPCPVCKTIEHPKADKKGHLCKPCASNRAKKWQSNNPERFFFNQIRAKYGISKSDYLTMFEQQGNKCAICAEEETAPNTWKKDQPRRLAVDHDHGTGEVRGLLCYRCNTTLGKVEDNIDLLKKMIEYLENSQ